LIILRRLQRLPVQRKRANQGQHLGLAERLFKERGFEAVTVAEIMKAAGHQPAVSPSPHLFISHNLKTAALFNPPPLTSA
jgi:hypothetical protein